MELGTDSTVRLTLIAAMDRNRGIGYRNALPWRLPADMRYFKETTWGHPVLMGRRTYESIGRPLPGRTNLVLSRTLEAGGSPGTEQVLKPGGIRVVRTVEQALAAAGAAQTNVVARGSAPALERDEPSEARLFVIGGAELYRQTLPMAERVLLTVIEAVFSADAWFPELPPEEWELVSRLPGVTDAENPYVYAFLEYRRKASELDG